MSETWLLASVSVIVLGVVLAPGVIELTQGRPTRPTRLTPALIASQVVRDGRSFFQGTLRDSSSIGTLPGACIAFAFGDRKGVEFLTVCRPQGSRDRAIAGSARFLARDDVTTRGAPWFTRHVDLSLPFGLYEDGYDELYEHARLRAEGYDEPTLFADVSTSLGIMDRPYVVKSWLRALDASQGLSQERTLTQELADESGEDPLDVRVVLGRIATASNLPRALVLGHAMRGLAPDPKDANVATSLLEGLERRWAEETGRPHT
jgi:hypothetical protein